MTSSAALLKSYKKRLRYVLLGLAALLLLALTLGPDLLLKALLTRVLPSELGLAVSYDRAEAGFFFRSVTIDNLNINDREDELRFSAGHLGLKRLSFFNLLRLVKNPYMDSSSPVTLAGEINIRGLSLHSLRDGVNIDHLEARELTYQPRAAAPRPLCFDKLEARGYSYAEDSQAEGGSQVRFSRLEARALSPDFLGGLKLEGLELAYGTAENRMRLDLSGLSIGGLDFGSLAQATVHNNSAGVLRALGTCDSLELAPTVLTRGEREILNIGGAVFDTASGPEGSTIYTRRLDFAADLEALPTSWDGPSRQAALEIFGSRVALDVTVEFQSGDGLADLKELRIHSPELGQLSLSARLNGLTGLAGLAARPSRNRTALLLAVAGARLENLSLAFADAGVMAKWYRYLDTAAFKYAPSRNSADNIMAYYLEPLARDLEHEQGLANLPVLLSEAQAFLSRPESLAIAAAPPQPLLLMSLANLDKYDIIEKLHLTAQVNDRAPVAVAARAGVFHERLPNAPRPMETLFEEDLD